MCKRIYKEQTSEHGEVPFFKIGTFGSIPDAFISRSLFEEYRALYPYPKPGTLLISAAGSIGRIVKYAGEEAYYQDSNIVWLEHNEVLDDEFLAAVFDRHDWTALEGSTIKRLYNKDLLDFKLSVPTASEQHKIGSLFQGLNNLITLHQRKCQYRSLYGYLSWEQRKLNEYLETSREKNESCHFGKDDVLSVSGDYGIVNQIEFQGRSYAGTSVANYGVVHKGDVVYTKSPLRINPYGIIKTNRGNDGIVSTLYAVYHPTEKTHPDFVQVYFEQNARMNNYMAPLVSKGAKNDMKVSAENALKGAVTFPGIKEQEVIASYFSQLDDLITLHQ